METLELLERMLQRWMKQRVLVQATLESVHLEIAAMQPFSKIARCVVSEDRRKCAHTWVDSSRLTSSKKAHGFLFLMALSTCWNSFCEACSCTMSRNLLSFYKAALLRECVPHTICRWAGVGSQRTCLARLMTSSATPMSAKCRGMVLCT